MKRPTSSKAVASGWNVVLGIWVLISPFVLGFNQNSTFVTNNVILGIVVAILAIIHGAANDHGVCSWLNVLAGIWLIISPFVLGFSNLRAPMWNNIIMGILIGLVALASTRETLPEMAERHRPERPTV